MANPFIEGGMSRRQFTVRALLATGALGSGIATMAASKKTVIQTVLGPVAANDFGPALAHEHVMCDFIGADETSPRRWEAAEVVRKMLPYMRQLKGRGVTGFVDCTPAYIGRDPRVLLRLASETGLHIVTNTGYYGGAGDKFVPKHAYSETIDQLADRWVCEWENGIEDTGIKPGFIKIGVDEALGNPPALSDIDAKLVKVAARASKRTGLATVCHTGGGTAGLASVRLFIVEGGEASRFIVAHSDGHGLPINEQIAGLGAWISFDAISRQPLETHIKLVMSMLDKHAGRLLLSHDNGWYWVGQKGGGEVRDFNYISDQFLPALRTAGASDAIIRKLTVENPARALASAKRD
jgi:phosphotriesterase-related protein